MKKLLGVLSVVALAMIIFRKKEEHDNEPNTNSNINAMNHESFALTAQSPNFKMAEFNSHDGTVVPTKYRGNVQTLMNQLEVIRSYFNAPVTINSGYRSPAHNKNIGGVADSMHLFGKAADIKVAGYSPSQVHAGILKLIKDKRIINGGVGKYSSFTHYDIGPARRWNG